MKKNAAEVKPMWLVVVLVIAVSWAMTVTVLNIRGRYQRPSILGKGGKFSGCTAIQSGELLTSDGEVITPGYNEWGYNYQANMFNGNYCDYHPSVRPGGANHQWCIDNYGDVKLEMKWNDAWLSNKDCDGDGKLDRHLGYDSYIGSGAWETNHMQGGQGKDSWTYFVKIVAAPDDAYKDGGTVWYSDDGEEIGPDIWGQFAIIQEMENGAGAKSRYKSPVGPGFGHIDNL